MRQSFKKTQSIALRKLTGSAIGNVSDILPELVLERIGQFSNVDTLENLF